MKSEMQSISDTFTPRLGSVVKKIRTNRVALGSILVILFCTLPFWPALLHPIPQSDLAYTTPDVSGNLSVVPDLWSSYNFGSSNSQKIWTIAPLRVTYYILHLVANERMVQFILLSTTLLLSMVGMYLLLRSEVCTYRRIPAFIGALFFAFNTYAMENYTSSFIPMMAHAALPFQLLFLHRALERSHLYVFALVGVTALVAGVNLIFTFISSFLVLTYTIYHTLSDRGASVAHSTWIFVSFVVLTLLMTAWWSVPFIGSSLIDNATTNNILSSETFYNNDSSPAKVIRLLGDWSFFASHNGIPYKWYSIYYKDHPLVVAASSALLVCMILGAMVLSKHINRNKRIFGLYLTIVLVFTLFFMGGKHPDWSTSSWFAWAFEHIPFFSAFRNTRKWLSLGLLVGSILIAAIVSRDDLQQVWRQCSDRTLTRIRIVVVAVILIAAFPMTSGLWFERSVQIEPIPEYWFDMAHTLDTLPASDTRVLQTPNQYFDVYEWNGRNNNIPGNLSQTLSSVDLVANTCKGCGNPNVLALLSHIYGNMNNTLFLPFLGKLGITHILQRNDYAYDYYQTQSPETMRSFFMTHSLATTTTIGQLDLYTIPSELVSPRVFVPKTMVVVDSLDEAIAHTGAAPAQTTAFALRSQISWSETDYQDMHAAYVRTVFHEDTTRVGNDLSVFDDIAIPAGATYHLRPNFGHASPISLYAKYNGDALTVEARYRAQAIRGEADVPLHSADRSVITPIAVDNHSSPIALFIGSSTQAHLFDVSDTAWRYLAQANAQVPVPFSLVTNDTTGDNLLLNGAFKDGPWNEDVRNCGGGDTNGMTMSTVYDDAIDSPALRIKANDGNACTMSASINDFVRDSVYTVSLKYRHVLGGNPAICVWDGFTCLAFDSLGSHDTLWHDYTTVVRPSSESSQIVLFLYSDGTNFDTTQNEFAQVAVRKGIQWMSEPAFIFTPTLDLNQGTVEFTGSTTARFTSNIIVSDNNLLQNGDFEEGSWAREPSNCRHESDDAKHQLAMETRDDVASTVLTLSAENDMACVSGSVQNELDTQNDYLLSYEYQVSAGFGHVCVWDGAACLAYSTLTSTDSNTWRVDRIMFTPRAGRPHASVFLYADATSSKYSEVSFDNVTIQRLEQPILGEVLLTSEKDSNEPSTPTAVLYHKESNERRTGTLTLSSDRSFPLIFLETYHPDWILTVRGVAIDRHFVANGFANGWVIDPKALGLPANEAVPFTLTYAPKRWFTIGLIVSGLTLVCCIAYFLHVFARRTKLPAIGRKDATAANR